jgi:tetratricopeptide (TPR) repeat protein
MTMHRILGRKTVLVLAGMFAFSAYGEGLRNLKVGDKLPAGGALEIFRTPEAKILLCLDSSRPEGAEFFEALAAVLDGAADFKVFLIDVNREKNGRIGPSYDGLKIAKAYVPDPEKKIYGELGVIVLPTLLFLTKDNALHSYVAGFRSNLALILRSHVDGFRQGKSPDDPARRGDRILDERGREGDLDKGFRMLAGQNYALAAEAYRKALDLDAGDEAAQLGYGYALLLGSRRSEGVEHFSAMMGKRDDRRAALGYHLGRALTSPSEEDLKRIAELSILETSFFPAVAKAAEILDQAGRIEDAKRAYRHAFNVLFSIYKRMS